MIARIFQTKYLILLIVFFTLINALAFVGMGIILSFEGIAGIVQGQLHTDHHPGLKILESLDVFLVALVFLIFALGIARLFLPIEDEEKSPKLPEWLNIKTFTDLKMLLWETVLTTLVVYFVSDVVKHEGHYTWEMLILPGSILFLSLSIFIVKKNTH